MSFVVVQENASRSPKMNMSTEGLGVDLQYIILRFL